MMRHDLYRARRLALLLGAATLAAPLAAQTAAADDAGRADDIVVTANRAGEQSLQSVAIAITAVDPARLTRSGTVGLTDLTRAVPALNIVESGPGINKIEIRGLTTGQFVPNSTSDVQDRSLVAVYLDDAAISLQGQNPDLKVVDLERVEVLRGPQGTLYGAGSMSGTIRYITAKPDAGRIFGSGEIVGAKSEDAHAASYSGRAMLNVPLIADTLAVRATGYYGHDAGYIDNVAAQNRRDANSVDTIQGRVALRLKASEALTADLSYTYLDLDAKGLNRAFGNLPDYTFSSNGPEHNKDRMHLVNLTLNYDADWGSIVSSTSYTKRKLDFLESLEPTIAYFFEYQSGPGGSIPNPRPAVYTQSATNKLPVESYSIKNDIEDFQQEIRFTSDQTKRLRVTAGVFYQKQKRYYLQDIPVPGFDTLSYQNLFYSPFVTNHGTFATYDSKIVHGAFQPNDVFSGIQDIDEYQIAGFGEASFDITPALTVTAGARVFYWKQKFDLYFGGVYGVDTIGPRANEPITAKDGRKADGVNPRAVISYKVDDDILLFAEAAKGFRYGGVNQPIPRSPICDSELASVGGTAPTTFGPDSLWTYSVGEKARVLDRRVTINGTAFLIDWKAVQNRVVLPQCAYYYIQNNGRVRSVGAELEIAARLTDALTLTFNGSYTHAESRIDVPGAQALKGDKVPNFPGTVVGLGLLYDAPMGPGEIHVAVSGQYRESYGNLYNRNGNPTSSTSNAFNYRTIPSQNTLNASVAYAISGWEVGVFGTNLTNGTKITNIVPKAQYIATWQAGDYLTYARPRTLGVRLRKDF